VKIGLEILLTDCISVILRYLKSPDSLGQSVPRNFVEVSILEHSGT
jgi:hypothetical protein